MNFTKKLLFQRYKILFIFIIWSIFWTVGVQIYYGINSASIKKDDISDKKAKEMLRSFTTILFTEMNPKKAFKQHAYLGKLNKTETEEGIKDLFRFDRKIPVKLKSRYAMAYLEGYLYKFYFALGKKDFSDNFGELFGLSYTENKKFDELAESVLKKNNLSQEGFDNFFEQDNNFISNRQISKIEKILDDILILIRKNIDVKIYQKNIKKLNNSWEITDSRLKNKSYYLFILKPLDLAFIVGSKNNLMKIIGSPDLIY